MGECWRKLARSQSRTCHFLWQLYFFPLWFLSWYWKKVLCVKGFVIHIETEDSIQQSDFFFWKKRIYTEWFAHAIAPPDDSTHVLPLSSVSKIESFSLLIMVMVHGSAVMGGARVQFTGRSRGLTGLIFVRKNSCTYQDPHRFLSWTIWSS